MAKILKCPRCQEKIDVTDLSGGSTVRCEACGTMVRVAGGTQQIPKTAAAPPPPPPPASAARQRGTTKIRKPGDKTSTKVRANPGAGRQTELFRNMNNARAPGEGGRPRGGGGKESGGGSNTGMIIAIAAAAIVVIGGIAFAVMSGKDSHKSGTSASSGGEKDSPKKKKKDEAKKTPRPPAPLPPSDTGVFKPGALGLIDKSTTPMMKTNPDTVAQYELLAGAGKASDIVSADYRWVTYVINGMLSDNEAVAKGSMDAMHQIIVKRKLEASQSDLAKQANIGGFNMPEMRSGEYTYWAQWWFTVQAQNAVAAWREAAGPDATAASGGGVIGNASTEDWARSLADCRSGGFANSNNPEYYIFQRVKSMGKSAYPKLVEFIDNEDTTIGKTAVLMLIELTGRSDANTRVNEGNKAQLKTDWAEYIKK